MTFEELITRVAEHLGFAYYGVAGDEDAQAPTVAADLALCKRIVNDGWRRFVGVRQRWNWMKPLFEISLASGVDAVASSSTTTTVVSSAIAGTYADDYFNTWGLRITSGDGNGQIRTITDYTGATGTFTVATWDTDPAADDTFSVAPAQCVDGDDAVYYMPDGYYGRALNTMNYVGLEGTNRTEIPVSDISSLQRLYAGTITSDTPYDACVIPLTGDDAGRWGLWVWPRPSSALTIRGVCEIYPNKLVELTDVPNCGFHLHRGVLQACLYEASLQHRPERVELTQQEWAMAAQESTIWDKENSPRRLGTASGPYGRHSRYDGVGSYTPYAGATPINLNTY